MAKSKKSSVRSSGGAASPKSESSNKPAAAVPAPASTPTSGAAPAKPAAVVAKPAATAPAAKPSPDRISARAHQIWLDEGRPTGKALEHWVRAERELSS
jgi:hypothetical protein